MIIWKILLSIIPILLISIIWTNWIGAPWLPSSMKKVRKMLIMANIKSGELVYDLGCGDGRVLITAAREFDARAVGIEIDPLRYIWSQARITLLGLRERVQVFYGDFFHQDLSKADIVTCYLLQSTNDKLIEKLNKELRLGARVISNTSLFRNSNLSTRMTSTKSLCIEKMQIADF